MYPGSQRRPDASQRLVLVSKRHEVPNTLRMTIASVAILSAYLKIWDSTLGRFMSTSSSINHTHHEADHVGRSRGREGHASTRRDSGFLLCQVRPIHI